jgi:hypothetical protein
MRRITETSRLPVREESQDTARSKLRVRAESGPAADSSGEDNSLVEQLHAMYAERELLEKRLGVSDANDIIAMISNLELQLKEFYSLKEEMEVKAKALRSQLAFVEHFV